MTNKMISYRHEVLVHNDLNTQINFLMLIYTTMLFKLRAKKMYGKILVLSCLNVYHNWKTTRPDRIIFYKITSDNFDIIHKKLLYSKNNSLMRF